MLPYLEAPEAVEARRAACCAPTGAASTSGTGEYATPRAQLAMEGRMLAQARADGAPRVAGRGEDAQDTRTLTGLRQDQAAAAFAALTDGKRVSVINAPAGSGKSRVLAELARPRESARLGPVVGITPSQSARNTLAAGIAESYNSAQFLGTCPAALLLPFLIPNVPG